MHQVTPGVPWDLHGQSLIIKGQIQQPQPGKGMVILGSDSQGVRSGLPHQASDLGWQKGWSGEGKGKRQSGPQGRVQQLLSNAPLSVSQRG